MRGEVLAYDDSPGTGLISGDDGARYAFSRADLQQLTPVRAGTRVDFVAVDGAATQVFVIAQSQPRTPPAGSGIYIPGVAGSGGTFDWRTLFLDANGRIGQDSPATIPTARRPVRSPTSEGEHPPTYPNICSPKEIPCVVKSSASTASRATV